MKGSIRIISYLLVLFGASVQSCGGDKEEKPDCYECTKDGYTDTYCFSYYKETYGWTRSEFDDYIDYLESDGYTCKAEKD